MRNLICSVCGRPATIGSLCDEHHTERYELFTVQPLEIKACDNCGAVFDRGVLKREPIDDAVRSTIERAMKSGASIERIDIGLKKVGEDYIATVTASGKIPPATVTKTETKSIKVRIRHLKCANCIRLLGRYHEAVVQVRGERVEQLMEIIDNIVGETPMRRERLKYGWNLYFVNKADARAAVSRLGIGLKRARDKRLEVIRSHKLVGRKLGKDLWRDFYAIR